MKRLYSCEHNKEIKPVVCTQIIYQCNNLKTKCNVLLANSILRICIEYSSFLGCDTVTIVVPYVSKDRCLHLHGTAAPPQGKNLDLSKHQEPLA